MGHIQRLPRHLIDRIAAGEVVERPASVVKELVENAIDAGASIVDVRLLDGGLGRIEVIDDGSGMAADDARLAVEAHTTSKLRVADDLDRIATLGFRGEALASMGAVAKLTIDTRPPDAAVGTRVAIQGGTQAIVEPVGCAVGTRVLVEDLFFNTPARRKFLRAPAAEQARVTQTLRQIAASSDRPALRLHAADRLLLDAPAVERRDDPSRVAALAYRDLRLYPFLHHADSIAVSGFMCAPKDCRRDPKGIWCSINGRSVREAMLQRAIMDAYGSLIEHGRYPVAVLRIAMPLEAVDANVHPQKIEVRFADPAAVYRAVAAAIGDAVGREPWTGSRAGQPRVKELSPADVHFARQTLPGVLDRYPLAPDVAPTAVADSDRSTLAGLEVLWSDPHFVLARSMDDQLHLIDCARACRMACDFAISRGLESGGLPPRELMLPPTVTVTDTMLAHLDSVSGTLDRWAYDLMRAGPRQVILRSVPSMISEAAAANVAGALHRLLESKALTPDSLGALTRQSASADALGIEKPGAMLLRLDALRKHGIAVESCYRRLDRSTFERMFAPAGLGPSPYAARGDS